MLVALVVAHLAPSGSLLPVQLRCEALVDPVGIGTATPRLSWKLNPRLPNSYDLDQTGYEITVGSKPGAADFWSTGKVKSSQTVDVPYRGRSLTSGQPVWWQVRVYDEKGRASGWSKPAKWSIGLLNASDWKAQWIGFDEPSSVTAQNDPFRNAQWMWSKTPADQVRLHRRVNFPTVPNRATAHISVDDQFTLRVNGKVVASSDGKTDAWRRPTTIDLKPSLKVGENQFVLEAKNNPGGQAGALFAADMVFGDKSYRLISDGNWEATVGDRSPAEPVRVISAYGGDPWGKLGPQTLVLPPPRLLRKVFALRGPVKRAVLYGSALGLLELRLNGEKVGNEYFMPGWTDYAKRVYVRGYDVTNLLRSRANALGIVLGDGWYAGYVGYGGRRNHYGSKIRALAQLEIEYQDGSKQTVGTDSSWRASTGPVEYSDFLMGETYDANKETAWDTAGFTATGWKSVDTGSEMSPAQEPFPGQPVTAFAVLKPKRISEPKKGVYVLDLGQNMAGFARLQIRGRKGMKVQLRFAERLNPDGTIYTTNLRSARATDTYVSKGAPKEVWEPKFTFHGFQYIEVTGLDHKPSGDEVVGVAVSSNCPSIGTIETSDGMINKLISNALWTQRANFIDIPTDCPQRDERLGWTGDAQAYVRTASMLADVQPFFTKWLVALDDAQRADGQYPMVAPVKVAGDDGGPAWADAGVICPWTIYNVYGDKQLLARHYPQMKKFIEFCVKRSTPDLLPPKQFHCFGDWLNINSPTPNEVIYTAYFAGSTRIVADAAAQLEKVEEATKYRNLYERIRTSFQKEYVAPDGTVRGDSQCAYVLALAFDLLPAVVRQKSIDRFIADIERRGWHLSTGFVGTRDIMNVLSKIGRNDVAFRLLHNKTFPSWGFTIVNGATSIWERWDGWTPEKGFQDPGMNSFAHYAFGAVVGWIFDQPAGIRSSTPGFAHPVIAPQIDPNLSYLRSSYDSVRGKLVSNWSVKNGKLTMKVVVPPNVRAQVYVPATNVHVRPNRLPARMPKLPSLGNRPTPVLYQLGSGEYEFTGDIR
jgi:alpha-L-rhamnosidase